MKKSDFIARNNNKKKHKNRTVVIKLQYKCKFFYVPCVDYDLKEINFQEQ